MDGSVEFHSSLSKDWAAKYSKRSFRSRYQAFSTLLDEFVTPGQLWLDAGCGAGNLSLLLQSKGAVVRAIDASPDMVKACPVPATVADIRSLPFAAASFDGIVCSSVMEYLPVPAAVLAELARVLKPEGTLLISVANKQSAVRIVQKALFRVTGRPAYMRYSLQEFAVKPFQELLRGAGFVPLHSRPCGALMPLLAKLPLGHSLRLHAARKISR